MRTKVIWALALWGMTSACGYHVAGRANLVPKSIQTVAIAPFGNATTRYRLTDRLPAALTREFISRTKFQIIDDPAQADAVLSGTVINVQAYPTTFDPVTGRAAGVQMAVILQLKFAERATGKDIYSQPALDFRERYEISVDASAYFDESTPAFDRLSQDVARRVVTAILTLF